MKRSKKFEPILKISKNTEDQAAQVLAQVIAKEQQERLEIEELEHYREEYQQGLFEKGRSGTTGANLASMHDFIMQIDQVVQQKLKKIEEILVEKESAQKKLWECQKKTKSLENLVAGIKSKERLLEDQKEQKQMDELNLRMKSPPFSD